MKTIEHSIPNGDGWQLSLFQTWDEERLLSGRRPVLIVPGYGMNSFIFSWHPRGLSLEGYLARAGCEVWRVDLRGQGGSRSTGGGDDYQLEDLALTDLGAAVRAVLDGTRTGASRVDILGASLGGTIMFAHAVLNPSHAFGALVALGSPVRWVDIHPLLELAFSSPALAGMVRLRGTRRLAELALPFLAKRAPWVLSHLHEQPRSPTPARPREMVRTVEDPNRHVNRQIAHWIRDKDLDPARSQRRRGPPRRDGPAALRQRLGRRHRSPTDCGVPLPRGRLAGEEAAPRSAHRSSPWPTPICSSPTSRRSASSSPSPPGSSEQAGA